jgi:hypothetical protein
MKTPEEIKQEITALKTIRPKVRPRSIFGTDNLAQLDAQINVLENDLDNSDIYEEYDHSGIDEDVLSAAIDARQWMDGEGEEDDLASGYPLLEP